MRLYDELHMSEIDSFTKWSSANLTNKLWCQSSANQAVGTWFFPNGNVIQNDTNSLSLRVIEEEGQIGLFLEETMEFSQTDQGLYVCIIPDEEDINQTLAVGIFDTNFFNLARKFIYCTNPAL